MLPLPKNAKAFSPSLHRKCKVHCHRFHTSQLQPLQPPAIVNYILATRRCQFHSSRLQPPVDSTPATTVVDATTSLHH
ncbi:hypothetical protein IC582_005191 [Cucumis melo]|uniref:Uncharacterized protein n=1 Tax=Cucumis melo TaxID=3656 RepID=A0A9I9E7R0_CUCME